MYNGPQYNRQFLIWSDKKEKREQQYKIVDALLEVRKLNPGMVMALKNYLDGYNTLNSKKAIDTIDEICYIKYLLNDKIDKEKNTYKDWLEIDVKHLYDINLFYTGKGIIKGLSKIEYQRQYRIKAKEEKSKFIARYKK